MKVIAVIIDPHAVSLIKIDESRLIKITIKNREEARPTPHRPASDVLLHQQDRDTNFLISVDSPSPVRPPSGTWSVGIRMLEAAYLRCLIFSGQSILTKSGQR